MFKTLLIYKTLLQNIGKSLTEHILVQELTSQIQTFGLKNHLTLLTPSSIPISLKLTRLQ